MDRRAVFGAAGLADAGHAKAMYRSELDLPYFARRHVTPLADPGQHGVGGEGYLVIRAALVEESSPLDKTGLRELFTQ